MFAVSKSGGRQCKVYVGRTLEVNRLSFDDGAQVKFEEVLLISDANGSMIGTPLLDNAMVLATAVKQDRGKKLIVFRYKSKKRFRHRRGHRQELTVLTIDDIVADGKSLITGQPPVAKEEPVEEEEATPVTTETDENETPESDTEQRTTRRRRTAKVEDTESKAEEE